MSRSTGFFMMRTPLGARDGSEVEMTALVDSQQLGGHALVFLPKYVAVLNNIKAKYPAIKRIELSTFPRAPGDKPCAVSMPFIEKSTTFGSSTQPMPPAARTLAPDEIADVVAWMLSRRPEFPGQPYSSTSLGP